MGRFVEIGHYGGGRGQRVTVLDTKTNRSTTHYGHNKASARRSAIAALQDRGTKNKKGHWKYW